MKTPMMKLMTMTTMTTTPTGDRVTEVVVVTSDFHGSRVQRVFEAVFEDCRHSFIALSFANAPATLTEAQVAREARAETQMLAKFDADLQRHLAMTW
jgi:5S rRNA maturation endonuclease (ribonuclease M5)